MFNKLKKKLYFDKLDLLYFQGIKEGKIVPFDEELYEKMSHVYFNCIPISMHIRYLRPIISPGKCYDRSLYMFFCFDDSLLVRGDTKYLEFEYGKENAGHGWIEIGEYVYDPSTLMRYEKDYYYKMYNPSNVTKITKEQYNSINNNYYDEVRNTSIYDYKTNGSKRMDLLVTIPLLEGLAELSCDEQFQTEVLRYLEEIEYDSQKIYEQSEEEFLKLLKQSNKGKKSN